MLTGKKIILFGAGIIGRRALNFFGPDKVHCFADNIKAGQMFWGKPVISFDELKAIHSEFDVVISTGLGSSMDIKKQCESAGVEYDFLYKVISHEDYESNPEIAEFKDKHKGERCFLIGNGPSLTPEDLTVLHEHGEICFGCNFISKIFDKTPWRPNYYVFGDPQILLEIDSIPFTEVECCFAPVIDDIYIKDDVGDVNGLLKSKSSHTVHYRTINHTVSGERVPFSPDVSRVAYIGGSIAYVMLQLATYMGFCEIYLLGVDGTMGNVKDPKRYLAETRHFYEDDEELVYKASQYMIGVDIDELHAATANAYKSANEYTREHGSRIYNATRGGVIETFKRVDFDFLF